MRVSAAATDGEANAALVAFLARRLRRPKSAVRIVAGEASRLKTLEIEGLDQAELDAAFGQPPGS